MVEKIILGTVQLGMEYGINNSTGMPNRDSAAEILSYAFNSGITTLDTADSYGSSYEVISEYMSTTGNFFKVITKFQKSTDFNLTRYIDKTLASLQINEIEALLFHRFHDSKDKNLFSNLIEYKRNKIIKNIGVSVYSNDELSESIDNEYIDIIQVPFNLLDNFQKKGELLKKAKFYGKVIHARSVFLQGLFFMKHKLPTKIEKLSNYLNKIQNIAISNNYTINQLALNYALQQNEVDCILIGVDQKPQLIENLELIKNPLSVNIIEEINNINVVESELLNPSNWK